MGNERTHRKCTNEQSASDEGLAIQLAGSAGFSGKQHASPDRCLLTTDNSILVTSGSTDEEQCFATPRSSPPNFNECIELLHQLSNVITGVIVNAQMLDWKLPPYSRVKRPVREIERNAQRGGALLKGLQQRLGRMADTAVPEGVERSVSPEMQIGESSIDGAAATGPALLPNNGHAFSGRTSFTRELTKRCDPCTSAVFPKRDDGKGR